MRKANIIITALVILVGISTVFGQSVPKASTPTGMKSGASAGSYALDGFDSINYQNGSLNFSFPLVTIGGRGEASFTMMATFENRWSVNIQNELISCGPSNLCNYQSIYYPSRSDPFVSKAGLTPGFLWATHTGRYAQTNCQGTNTAFADRLTTVTFAMPGGSAVTFYDQLSDGKPLPGSACGAINGPNRGNVFVARDGSGMTFVSDTNLEDKWTSDRENPSGTVFTKTGVKYRIDGGTVSSITDRQGNKITFTYIEQNRPELGMTVTDSLGRWIELVTGPTGIQTITFKGTGEITRSIRIGWTGASGLRSDYTQLTYAQAFPELNGAFRYTGFVCCGEGGQIELPDGRKYKFLYNQYGDLARVELPTGGAYEYDWETGFNNTGSGAFSSPVSETSHPVGFVYRRVVEKRTYDNGGSGASYTNKTTVSKVNQTPDTAIVTVKDYMSGNSTPISRTDHYYKGDPVYGMQVSEPFYPETWDAGKEYKTEVFSGDGTQLLRRSEQLWQAGSVTNFGQGKDPRVIENKTTLADTNQIAVTTAIHPTNGTVGFDQYNNQTDVYEYDYGVGQLGTLKRRTHTDFVTDPYYINNYLRSLPSQTWISSDADGQNIVSKSQIEYDSGDPLVLRSNVVGHDTANYGITKTIRGNATKVTSYSDVNDTNTAISVKSQYDILGNVVKTTDAKGCSTTIDYADRFGSPDNEARSNLAPTQLGGLSTFAFPTSSTNCLGWVVGYSQFDYFTGQPVNTEDLNGVISKTIYNDLLDRPTQSVSAIGTAFEMQSNITYRDGLNERNVEVKSDLFRKDDNLSKSVSFYDGLGRTFESRKYESDGGYIASKTEFDALGRTKRSTNPYRPQRNESELWTTTNYDALSRKIEERTSDDSKILTSYYGNAVTVTDQANKKRRVITNALGQLERVDEPNTNGLLDVNGVPAKSTNYSYDASDNLIQINQGNQVRNYSYDSLDRLLTATNPESGTITYKYDKNNNLIEKKDARNVISTIAYDSLNRPLTKVYTDGTPSATYSYDNPLVDFSKGKLTKIDNGTSITEYTNFDALGQTLSHRQTTDGQIYNTGYKYDLSGNIIEQTYPSGKIVRSFYDTDGDLSRVAKNGKTNASDFSYTSHGDISSLRLGNGRWESTQFNVRFQPTQIALGNAKNSVDLWKINYEFGITDNNNNIKSQTLTVPTIGNVQGFTAIQTHEFDSLDRLTSATETNTNGQQNWKQTFIYDRFGNRTFDEANTTSLTKNCIANNLPVVCANERPKINPQIDQANNKFLLSEGYIYDSAGNLTQDAEGKKYIFNSDNKQTEVRDAVTNALIATYSYDGDGNRVKKTVTATGEQTIFVYDASGILAAEYSLNISPPQNPTTQYLTSDYLGTPRVVTNSNGAVISRRDLMPFGEDLLAGIGSRSANTKYEPDNIRQKFTGKLRDNETGLDYFEARYYSSKFGRFTTSDEFIGGPDELWEYDGEMGSNPTFYAEPLSPQTLNKYQYGLNNPLKYLDPDGHQLLQVFLTPTFTATTMFEAGPPVEFVNPRPFIEVIKPLGPIVDNVKPIIRPGGGDIVNPRIFKPAPPITIGNPYGTPNSTPKPNVGRPGAASGRGAGKSPTQAHKPKKQSTGSPRRTKNDHQRDEARRIREAKRAEEFKPKPKPKTPERQPGAPRKNKYPPDTGPNAVPKILRGVN